MCFFFPCPSRAAEKFYCSSDPHLDFPLGTVAIAEVVTGLLFSLPFSPWAPIPHRPSLPLFLNTLLVCLRHEGESRGCAVTLLLTRPLHALHCLPKHRGTKAIWRHCSRSPVVILEAVDLIFRVHGEGHSVKALVTDDTAEAAWVVGLPQGL